MLVDELAERRNLALKRHRGGIRSAIQEGITLAIPTTYVNVSGPPIARIARRAANLIVCHDELDLPLGCVRLKAGGGSGGHNGVKSIVSSLRSQDFVRLRLGIGRPPQGEDPAGFVLRPFNKEEQAPLEVMIDTGIEALQLLIAEGFDRAQNWLHGR